MACPKCGANHGHRPGCEDYGKPDVERKAGAPVKRPRKRTCTWCAGTGEGVRGRKCSRCDGTGEVDAK